METYTEVYPCSNPANGGYYCAHCGQYVNQDTYHMCSGYYQPYYSYPIPEERLYKLLEEIRDAIKNYKGK